MVRIIRIRSEKDMSDVSSSINEIKQYLEQLLNEHPISTDSIEGWILIFLIAFIVWGLYKKALKFVGWSCAVILLIQVGYFLGTTNLNNIIPLSTLFQYDVLTAIAQTCVGTPICDVLLKINAAIRYICINTWDTLQNFSLRF